MTATQDLADTIKHLHPCQDAVQWLRTLPANTRPLRAWRLCQRGDWMLWIIGKTINCPPWSDGRKPLVACCLDCAETVKHIWPTKNKDKIAAAIEVLRAWIRGTATVEQAQKAREGLYAYATGAAAFAAYAAAAAAAAAYAAYAAAARAGDAAAAAARVLAECAEIVRRHYPKPPKVRPK